MNIPLGSELSAVASLAVQETISLGELGRLQLLPAALAFEAQLVEVFTTRTHSEIDISMEYLRSKA